MLLRLRVVGWLCLVVFAALGARLHTMQVLEADRYDQMARDTALVVEREPAPRGRLYDRRGRLVVSNQPHFELFVVPAELECDARELARALGQNPEELKAGLDKAAREAPLERLVLKRNLDARELTRAVQLSRSLAGVYLHAGARRRYLYGKTAAHVLGYVGEITSEELRQKRGQGYVMGDLIGKAGLEKQYDRLLRGEKSIHHVQIDVLGRTVRSAEACRPIPGMELHLTLDMKLQTVAEEALAETLKELARRNGERNGGAVVALEPSSGRVLALASLPEFDPRPFARGIKASEYTGLVTDPAAPMVNRAVHSAFSPGSTFKMITGSSALQEGLCTPSSVFYCGGNYGPANCFVTSGHGSIGFEGSLAHSCDVVYYRLGDILGIKRLHRYCAEYGLGSPTGIDLPEESGGLLPDEAWKREVLGEEWYGGDTVNMSIGQGFLLVTPLQMAVATAAVANGGDVYRPYLVERVISSHGGRHHTANPRPVRRLPIKPEWLSAVRKGMRGAVLYGTSTAADSEFAPVAGKTGTVETGGRNHVWFVSFAPYQKARIVVVVFLEKSGGYGGSLAAPIARKVLDAFLGEKP